MKDPNISTGSLTPVDIWKAKDEFIHKEKVSREAWEKMTDDQRKAVLDLVDKALERLHAHLDTWVPSSLEVVGGNYIDCTFRILFSELDEKVRLYEEVTEREIRAAAQEAERLVAELGEQG